MRELSSFFLAQLDFEKQTKDGQCQRAALCVAAGVAAEQWPDSDYRAERCHACGRLVALCIPPHLDQPAQLALRFDGLKEGGARFDYPDALTPYEWTLIEALQIARRKGQADAVEGKAKEMQEAQRVTQFEADLRKMRGTG